MLAVVVAFEVQQVIHDELTVLKFAVKPDVSAPKGAYCLLYLNRDRDEASETVIASADVGVAAN